jgi:hypothetical protein
MARFKLNGKPVGGKGPSTKLPTGRYKVRLEKQFIKDSENNGRRTEYFISEFTVLEVLEGGKGEKDKHGNEFPDTKKGDYRGWSLDMSRTAAAGNLNEFLAAVVGTDPKDPEALKEANIDFEELLDVALDSKNEMRGAEVEVQTGLKHGANDFMAYTFRVPTA